MVNWTEIWEAKTVLAESHREGFMGKSELELSLLLNVFDMSILALTKFIVIPTSFSTLQNLYFHVTIISLLNSMESHIHIRSYFVRLGNPKVRHSSCPQHYLQLTVVHYEQIQWKHEKEILKKSWEIWEGFINLSRILEAGMISHHSILLLSNLTERYIFHHSISTPAQWWHGDQTWALPIYFLLKFPFQGS